MNENISAIFEGLNSEQHNAVSRTQGPVLIVAGAGSGKTRVLTCRIANILAGGVPSDRVMSLTFTKKAAAEMKERIASLVGYRAARGLVMGTFHSVFIRFLRDYSEYLGYPKDFTIYDTSDSVSLIKACLKELNLDDKVYKPKTVLSRISEAKNNLATPAAYMSNSTAVERDRVSKMPRLAEVYDLYWKKCRASGVMDFDDILFEMNILLRHNAQAKEEISARFDYILVDEYQDTNRAQYLILRELAARHHNICVVGDDSQSIYAFRGARIENILNFRKDYPECAVFRLEQNYRSTQTIVDAANSVIEHNSGRIPKKCFSAGEKGAPIHLIKAYTDQEEAMLVVSSIADIIRREGAQYQDFAVLYRTNAQSRVLEEALRRRNIPYMIYSGNSFFERAEVKDLMAYFKLVVNPSDDESFKRIVNKPARGIGDTSLSALAAAAMDLRRERGNASLSLLETAYDNALERYGLKPAGIAKIRQFTDMILRFHNRVADGDAWTLCNDIASDSGLMAFYRADMSVEGQARLANVEELLNSVKSYQEQCENDAYEDALAMGPGAGSGDASTLVGADGASAGVSSVDADLERARQAAENLVVTLPQFLENVALLSAVDVEDDETNNKVALMTVHTSKGLEFPYVHIVGLEENLFPSGGNLARSNEIEEERRLFYVALTRAKTAVKLSFCGQRMRNGKTENNDVSRFVREIDSQYIDNPLNPLPQRGDMTAFNMGQRSLQSVTTSRRLTPATPAPALRVPDSDFQPSPVSELREGQRVEHNRFGFGKILSIVDDGGMKVTIAFDDYGEKVLLLKYAKIRII